MIRFIDESYDNEEDDLKRMQMIFDELDKFRSKSDSRIKRLVERNITYIRTQSKSIFKIGKNKTKRIKLLEKSK